MKKKIILGVTLFLMLLTLFALSVSAAETIETWDISATSSDNVTATLYDDDSLVISGTGNMKDWTSYPYAPWYSSYADKIKSVTIEEGVATIGDYAFYDCDSLTSIVIPDSVTTIGSHAFYYCDSLTSIVIPDSVTTIGGSAFHGCDSLTSIVIPDSLTIIGSHAFYGCSSLTSVVIPNSVTTIGYYAFAYCYSLTIYCEAASKPNGWHPDWNYYSNRLVVWGIKDSGVLENGFEWVRLSDDTVTISGYSSINSEVIIPSAINGYSVTTIGDSAFRTCDSLTSVAIPDSVTTIGGSAFYDCDSLTSVAIPDSVTTIGDSAFRICDSLTSVVIPDSVTTIGNYAFYYCDSLTSVVIPDSVTTIGNYAFYYCDALTIYAEAISKPSGWDSKWNYSDCPVVWGIKDSGILENGLVWVRLSDDTVIILGYSNIDSEVIIPSTIDGYSVTTIGYRAFYSCDSLTSVVIGDSVTTIGYRAFYDCDSLTSVVIGDSVTTIGEKAFFDCDFLTSIVIPDSVTTIGSEAFYGCDFLTSIVIPNSVTTISYSAFECCRSLTIYCEAESKPSGWSSSWNYSNRPVIWGNEAIKGGIFTFLGYSFNEENGSMAVGYEINYEFLRRYEEKTGETLSIGVVFASYDLLGGQNPVGNDGKAITLPVGKIAQRDITDLEYGYYDFIINGIDDSLKDYSLVISAYIYNGETVKYIQENGISDTVTGISYNEAKRVSELPPQDGYYEPPVGEEPF